MLDAPIWTNRNIYMVVKFIYSTMACKLRENVFEQTLLYASIPNLSWKLDSSDKAQHAIFVPSWVTTESNP